MNREIKVGIFLILIGVCIPLAVLPFVSGYSKGKGVFRNIYGTAIVFGSEGQNHAPGSQAAPAPEKKTSGFDPSLLVPREIPFRFVLALGVVFVFVGIVRLDRARRREPDRE
jgi:hypothetical protein